MVRSSAFLSISSIADHFLRRRDVPDSSASGGAALEQRKSDLLDFYVAVCIYIALDEGGPDIISQEISQRDFYGFWNYGDVMHTYDSTRHAWRYDVGGYAWDNGELGLFFV